MSVETTSEFLAALPVAITRMEQLIKTYPGDSFLESIFRQLKHVEEWTRGGQRPSNEQIAKLSFGLMASRSVQELDEECANLLHELSYFLHNWPTR